MPTLRGYVNGLTAGQAGPGCPPEMRRKRGGIDGWSAAAVRRHTRWLYSVDTEALAIAPEGGPEEAQPPTGQTDRPLEQQPSLVGIALTLTLRDCPETPDDWERLRRAWVKAVERLGAVRLHWVVEWQARKVPHLHCAIYFASGVDAVDRAADVAAAWLQRASRYGARYQSQHWSEIDGPLGWIQYLSKHAARGVGHYQRQGRPDAWAKTGRLWGHTGAWPVVEPHREELSWPEFWRFRRLARSWRIADARGDVRAAVTSEARRAALRRLRYARRMLASPDPQLSRVRGVSEWIPMDVSLRLCDALAV